MIYQVSSTAIIIFSFFVAMVLGLSFFFARKTKSASGYYAAGGQIHWAVNGIAFAGDYLSKPSVPLLRVNMAVFTKKMDFLISHRFSFKGVIPAGNVITSKNMS